MVFSHLHRNDDAIEANLCLSIRTLLVGIFMAWRQWWLRRSITRSLVRFLFVFVTFVLRAIIASILLVAGISWLARTTSITEPGFRVQPVLLFYRENVGI